MGKRINIISRATFEKNAFVGIAILFLNLCLSPLICCAQIDSLYGKYRQYSILTHTSSITLNPNGTFIYKSPIDVGYVPETMGFIERKGDTILFSYPYEIYPQAELVEEKINPNRNNIKIEIFCVEAT